MARTARFLLYALVVWAPLPLGSNRPIFWVINAFVAILLLVLFIGGELAATHGREFNWRPAAWIEGILVVWAAWMVIQAVPFTPKALHHPIWSEVAGSVPDARGAISINPSTTWATIAEFVPIVFLGVVAMRLAVDRQRVRFLLSLIVATGVAVAVYGFIARSLRLDEVVWLDQAAYEGFLTGTFIGRSAAATYFAIGLACAAALIAARTDTLFREQLEGLQWTTKLTVAAKASAVPIVAFVVILAALFDTGSRGGVIAAAVGLICIAGLAVRKRRLPWRAVAGIAGVAAIVFVAAIFLAGNVLIQRLAGGIVDEDRRQVYRDTIAMIGDRPLLGQGAGTFVDAFPLFRTGSNIGQVWIRAHSSYLQGAAELGLPVFLLVMVAIGWALFLILRGTLERSSSTPAAMAAIGASAGAAVQSMVDFSIQIQAIGLTLVVLIGAGLGEVLAPRTMKRAAVDVPATPEPTSPPARRRETISLRVPTAAPVEPVSSAAPETASVGEGRRLYVFGDVHGRLDLLDGLRAAIARDRAASPAADTMVVGLGDFIDRGPSSRGVIEALATDFFDCRSVYLRGNHEQMLLDFLENPERYGLHWFRNGAAETFRSYASDAGALLAASPVDYRAVRDRLLAEMPASHVELIRGLPLSFDEGGYFFVHAGARPGIPLNMQREQDLLWIREGFSDRDVPFAKVIVHGHTPVDQPYLGRYRINLDTGAYFTNRLTCLVLEGATRRLLASWPQSPNPRTFEA